MPIPEKKVTLEFLARQTEQILEEIAATRAILRDMNVELKDMTAQIEEARSEFNSIYDQDR